jgi:hypothetical protein
MLRGNLHIYDKKKNLFLLKLTKEKKMNTVFTFQVITLLESI